MKKADIKYGIISFVLVLFGFIIKGILDSIDASTLMYILAWIPFMIALIVDARYIYKKNKEEE